MKDEIPQDHNFEDADVKTAAQLKGRLRTIEGATLKHAHHFIVRRWGNLREVRRHAAAWLLLVGCLIGAIMWQTQQVTEAYSVEIPSEGTSYTEGAFGSMDNLNPIFASSPAERSASRLLFSQLLAYDERGQLQGELAQGWGPVDADGKVYTLTLRPNIRWRDGVPLTAKDVVYTFSVIKDADTKSPLYSSWRTITVEAVDEYTVRFTLPTPYAPFPNSLTVGILPQHVLGGLRTSELRTNGFNRAPKVTSGPFSFQDLRALDAGRTHYIVRMAANQDYFRGTPKLSRFHLHAYASHEQLANAYRTQEVAAVSDTSNQFLVKLENSADTQYSDSPLFNAVYAFLKTSSPVLQDLKVRQALELATDQPAILKQLGYRSDVVTGPLLPGQLGYNSDLRQPATNEQRARELLDQAGWPAGSDGKRSKGGQPLKLQLVTVSNGDYPAVAQALMSQWARIGVSFESQLVRAEDFQQNVVVPRAYDVLIYEIALGNDPDVYAYWHSSQANERGFNLSDYKSSKVDDALDSARSRLDPVLRQAKYKTFVQQWIADAPAIGLYRTSLTYVQNKNITSFEPRPLVDQASRFYNVRYWSAGMDLARPTR